ncbi:MAG: signal peptidase I [Pyrinomonadaceae bacterium]
MQSNKSNKPIDFGTVSSSDDSTIEIYKPVNPGRAAFWREGLRLVRDVFLIIAALMLFGIFIAQPVVVEGSSMSPQLHNGERLIVNKLVYYGFQKFGWGHVQRGDIVVFWFPDDPSKSFVKRIIGMPGESIEIRDNRVYIDGRYLSEPYLVDKNSARMEDFRTTRIEPHHYFVLGDNRIDSSDSREWGTVPEKYIYGKAFFRWWHPAKFGFIGKGTPVIIDPPEPQTLPKGIDDPANDPELNDEG